MIIWPGLRRGVSAMQRLLNSSYFYAPRTTSITQTRGAGTPTETRATVATVMGYAADAVLADGQTLLTVASGELRFQGARRISEGVWSTVDADGAPIPAATLKGAVVEAAETNLCTKSQEFDAWTASNGGAGSLPVVTTNQTVAPDGTTTADKVVFAAPAAGDLSALTSPAFTTVTSSVYTSAIYVKAFAAGDVGKELLTRHAGAAGYTEITLSADWQRLGNTETAAGVSTTLDILLRPTFGGSVGTVSCYLWGAQVELGSYATTYQATTTTAAARNADVLDDQVASNLTAAAGTVAFTWTPSHDPSGTIALCGSYVDASNYTALLHDATKYIWRKRIAGVNYDAELTAAYANGTAAKISLTWGASGINLAVDGTLGTAHANTDDAQLGTRWQWGADGNGGQQAGAAFKEMYLTPRTMSDAELQAITV